MTVHLGSWIASLFAARFPADARRTVEGEQQ